ncbi:hypothetical protein AB0K71_06505 [Streptomyces syringium]|uniref:hypothetical protein n=1 Tax=Streptomyces syringium TaxID=76729 RepID=UPI0033EA3496
MPKKKNARKKAAAWDEARWAERRRLVRQEAWRKVREARCRSAGEDGHEISRGLESRLAAFRENFEEPARMTEQDFDDMLLGLAGRLADAGEDPAYILACREVGYMVTDANQHMFSAEEVDAYLESVARHQEQAVDEDEAADEHDAGGDATGRTPQADAADLLEPLVGAMVERKDPRMALRVHVGLERISDLEGPEAAGYFGATFVTVVFGWLVGAREAGLAPREAGRAVEWIRDAFGADAERAVLVLAGLIGHPDARDGTVDDAMDELGDAFLPAAIWLVAGVVATAGGGDTAWLRQFDPAPAG